MPIGIMSAMPEEVHSLLGRFNARPEHVGDREFLCGTLEGREVVLVFSRWGKVAAAITATQLIQRFGVTELWFFGVAGAITPDLRIGDIVVADQLVQHDLDARPLFPQFEIPLSGRGAVNATPSVRDELLRSARAFVETSFATSIPTATRANFGIDVPKIVLGDIATGDRFVSTASDASAIRALTRSCICVDMESAAVAQACIEQSIPFGIVRVISDRADESAPIDFPGFVSEIVTVYADEIITRALRTKALV